MALAHTALPPAGSEQQQSCVTPKQLIEIQWGLVDPPDVQSSGGFRRSFALVCGGSVD
jgi:hypothetical protein